jgi:hypothetical protein
MRMIFQLSSISKKKINNILPDVDVAVPDLINVAARAAAIAKPKRRTVSRKHKHRQIVGLGHL